jgi:proteasome accessory factor C
MLALVPWLAEHDGVTIAEAARHFEVSEKQLEDDLWLVIMCGVPGYMPDQLIDIDFWDDGRIRVIEPLTLTRPMRLSAEEAVTLLIALRLMAQVPGVAQREAILTAMAKIESSMDINIAQASASTPAFVETHVDEAVLRVIEESHGSPLTITYASGSDDTVTERVIEIDRTLSVDGLIYLDAYCHRAGAQRTFRLDRVLSAQPSADEGLERPTGDYDMVPMPSSRDLEVVVQLDPQARWLVDVYGAEVLSTTPYTVRLAAHSASWAIRLVLSLGGAARVMEPASLRLAVLDAARAARAAYPQA